MKRNSIKDFHDRCMYKLSAQTIKLRNRSHMVMAIQCVRYVLREVLDERGVDELIAILRAGEDNRSFHRPTPPDATDTHSLALPRKEPHLEDVFTSDFFVDLDAYRDEPEGEVA